MSWDYRIIAPGEEESLLNDPGAYVPRTSLGGFREIMTWLKSRAPRWHDRDNHTFSIPIGPDGHVVITLITERQRKVDREALREWEQRREESLASMREHLAAYSPRDDEAVVEINVEGRGSGDITLIAQCAAWLNAVVLDCQTTEFLTPEQWLKR